jgi:hypothetical protein
MGSGNTGAIVRLLALALIAIAFWSLGKYATGLPDAKDSSAPAIEFSAARADATLARLLGPELPHPLSSAENANVRARIQEEFAKLGVKTSVYTGLGCNGREQYGYFVCGTAKDVIAEVRPGAGKAIVMLAHYDSVPAGPGASDDESGVATILESVRALNAQRIKSKHPILAVLTDGEEAGLLGASSFAHNPALRARVGVVVNVEARGNQGPSLLFQTSPGDSKLIDLYEKSVPALETSSLFAVIYKLLPNDTDLTVFLRNGFTGFNFAFSGNVAHYHTSLDRRENLSLSTLQQHGDNLLGVTRSLMQTDFASLKGGDDVYLSIFGKWLPRIASGWALPLALLSFVSLLLAAWLSRTQLNSLGQWAAALAMPPAVIIGSAAMGWLLFALASLISGQPDPSYAYPQFLRAALGLGVLSVVVLCSWMARPRLAALSVWLWIGALSIVTAALVPGLSPYFLFPGLVASILLPLQSRLRGGWTGSMGEIALLLAAIPAMAIWLSLSAVGEAVQGLVLHPLVTVPAAFGVMALIPLLSARRLSSSGWFGTWIGAALAAAIVAIVAAMQPAFSAAAPQRLSITLLDDHIAKKATWIAETAAPLPASVRAAARFASKPEINPFSLGMAWMAPAGAPRYTPPSATVMNAPGNNHRRVVLALHGTENSNGIVVIVPNGSGLNWAEIGGQRLNVSGNAANPRGTIIACASYDCVGQTIKLDFNSTKPVEVMLAERHFGLPADGQKIAASRPPEAVASQNGDSVLVLKRITLR